MHILPYLSSLDQIPHAVVPDGGPGSWKPSGSVYKLEIWPQREDGEPTSRDDQGK